MRVRSLVLLCAAFTAVAMPARAQDPSGGRFAERPLAVSEVRGGIFLHQFVGPKAADERSASLNAELLFNGPWGPPVSGFVNKLIRPRLMVGGTVNTAGYTSFAYGGLDWDFALSERWVLDLGLGVGVSNGKTEDVPGRINVGCSAGVFGQLGLGYRLTERWSVMGTAQHISNGGLCEPNHGINTLGVRAGYRF